MKRELRQKTEEKLEQKQQYGMNQRQVAEALGVSRTAVQQAENRAMKKIMKYLEERKIKREDFF